jgi:hypothetical protein
MKQGQWVRGKDTVDEYVRFKQLQKIEQITEENKRLIEEVEAIKETSSLLESYSDVDRRLAEMERPRQYVNVALGMNREVAVAGGQVYAISNSGQMSVGDRVAMIGSTDSIGYVTSVDMNGSVTVCLD